MAEQQKVTAGGKKKRRQARHKAKRARWRQRSFAHVQARRARHQRENPNERESLAHCRRWLNCR